MGGSGHVLFEATPNFNQSTTGFVFLPDSYACQGISAALHGDVGYVTNCYNQPSSGVWHHLAVVLDKSQTGGNEVALYVDGALQAPTQNLYASTNTNNFGNNPIYLFSRGGTSYFDSGMVDDFRIYNSALTPTQIQQIITGLPVAPYTIWPSSTTPTLMDSGDGGSVELGVKFRADYAGYITGLRFYKASANIGTHIGNIWTTSGALLGRATFTNETASGWQQVMFNTPIPVAANTVYVASYFAPLGHYSADNYYFASSGVDNPPLHALPNELRGSNGVYTYNSSSAFPANGYLSSNYWVDVVYTTASAYNISGTISGTGGAGTTVTLSGTANATTATDGSGNYSFGGLSNGSYIITPSNSGVAFTPPSQIVTVNSADLTGVNFTANPVALNTLTALPALLSFGNINVNSSASQTLTITNTGTTWVTVSGVSISGSGFTLAAVTTPFNLAAGAIKTLTATFAPTVAGSASGTITITSNATNPSLSIPLRGTGITTTPHSVTLSWTPSTSLVVGYNCYRSTSPNGPFTVVNTGLIPSTSYVDYAVQSGATYYYYATAVDNRGRESAPSSSVSATVP
jgi:hypothetical protein